MLPDWLAKPNAWFLLVLSIFLTLLVDGLMRRGRTLYASRSESTAKARLTYYYKALAEPPTLLESLAWIICFLPLPFALASILLFLRYAPAPTVKPVIDTHLSQEIGTVLLSILFFFTYLLFSMLAVHGIRVAYHLRHGQARYHEHYREGMQKQIDKIKKKFPKL